MISMAISPSGVSPAILPATAALEVRDLVVRYGATEVLHGVSLAVEPGSVYALLGRNGAGKSSLLRCLLGHQRPAAGRARLLGIDAWTGRAQALRRIGVVPEEPDAPPHLNAAELEAFCRGLYPRWDSAGLRRRLARFGVPLATPFGQLSKGQKSQTLLALALGHSPDVLVLDDPTLGLDAVARRAVFDELIGELAERGTTVLLASHDMEGIERIADRVGILTAGRMAVDEPLDELRGRFRRLTGPAGLADSDLAPFAPRAARALAWGREATVSRFDEGAFAALTGRFDVEARAMSLEEIFLVFAGEAAA
jgi:ABC-2 type transport system ATP-binding protein